jgi:hypothetical protein
LSVKGAGEAALKAIRGPLQLLPTHRQQLIGPVLPQAGMQRSDPLPVAG